MISPMTQAKRIIETNVLFSGRDDEGSQARKEHYLCLESIMVMCPRHKQ